MSRVAPRRRPLRLSDAMELVILVAAGLTFVSILTPAPILAGDRAGLAAPLPEKSAAGSATPGSPRR